LAPACGDSSGEGQFPASACFARMAWKSALATRQFSTGRCERLLPAASWTQRWLWVRPSCANQCRAVVQRGEGSNIPAPAEMNFPILQTDQPAIRNCDPVSIVAQVLQHVVRTAERSFGIGHPPVTATCCNRRGEVLAAGRMASSVRGSAVARRMPPTTHRGTCHETSCRAP
jgi:hypothetical protein